MKLSPEKKESLPKLIVSTIEESEKKKVGFDIHNIQMKIINLFNFIFNKGDVGVLRDEILEEVAVGDVKGILDYFDNCSKSKRFFIHLEKEKANLLLTLLSDRAPSKVLEIGTYLGYSAILVADRLGRDLDIFDTIEASKEHYVYAKDIIRHAGLSEKINVRLGEAKTVIGEMKKPYDFIFIDHKKSCYLADFKLLEDKGLIVKDTLIVADNVDFEAVKEYREYLEESPNYETVYIDPKDDKNRYLNNGMEISIRIA